MRIKTSILLPAILLLLSFNASHSQEIPLVGEKIREALLEELSGEIAKEHIIQISRFDRIQASEGWHQAALYVKRQLEKYGIKNAIIEKFPSDGSIKYYTWTPPMGWRIRSAELWVLKPQKMRLASYEEIPTSVAKGSQSADVITEVVAVERGTRPEDYQGIEVTGKIVLADGYAGDVHREAVIRRGAAGVITYLGRRDRMEYPDLVPYHGLWIKRYEQPKTTFGFTISRRNAEMILNMLKKGEKVILHAKVDGENYPSSVEMMSATIQGSKYLDQEILLLGHLDHYKPGANDNASGSAGLLELARTIQRLIDRRIIQRPKRTIRFLWVTEWNGTVPWLKAHPEVGERTIAAINLDMIGNDLEKTDSFFYFTKTPYSLPSFLNDLAENMSICTAHLNITTPRGSSSPFNYRIFEYRGGSDHWMLNDATIGVPALMFGHPDPFHHTIQDAPDKIDPTELKRVLFIAGSITLYMANAEDDDAITLANYVVAKGLGRLAADAEKCFREMEKAKGSADDLYGIYKESINKIKYSTIREGGAVRSILVFTTAKEAKEYIQDLIRNIQEAGERWKVKIKGYYHRLCKKSGFPPREITLSSEEKKASKVIPVRKKEIFTCPLNRDYLKEKLEAKEVEKIKIRGDLAFEVANYMNGKRSLLEIRNAVSAEYGPQKLKDIWEYVKILEKAGLVMIIE